MLVLLAIGGMPGNGAFADVDPPDRAPATVADADGDALWLADADAAGGTATFSTVR